ncbi:energy-coupling factor transporter transmembrane component T [Microbacterium sp. GXS0129]|uniref:energy-coupling factor transporter transmembrane component T n=1 Tax=Microbacterium sp. GXS0129 TaxID=3377836 RepID=UPI00383BEDEE
MTGAAGERRAACLLTALALLALLVSLSPPAAGAVLAMVAGVAGLCWLWRSPRHQLPLRGVLKSLLMVSVFVLVTVGVFSGIEAAVVAAARVVGLLAVAAVVGAAVPAGEMMAVIRAVLGPWRRLGVDPERVALVLSLTITTVPVLLRRARTIREVQRMRGLRPGLRFVLPLLVVALRHADTMADSLSARGL